MKREMTTDMCPVGHVNHVTINITSPMKMEIVEMNMGAIVMLVGKNGSGKSMVNQLVWIAGCVAEFCSLLGEGYTVTLPNNCTALVGNVFQGEPLDGTISVTFENMSVTMTITNNVCMHVDYDMFGNKVVPTGLPIYMSTNTRLFRSLIAYMQMARALGISCFTEEWTDDQSKEMMATFMIYDVLFWNRILRKKWDASTLVSFNATMSKMLEKPIIATNVLFDTIACTTILVEDGKTVNLASLGNGEQSLMMMALGSSL